MRLTIEDGMDLVSLLSFRNKPTSLVIKPILVGIVPVKELFCSINTDIPESDTIVDGIGPPRSLPLRSKSTSFAIDPSAVGSVPDKPTLTNSRVDTKPVTHVTPVHSTPEAHGSVEVKPVVPQTHWLYEATLPMFVAAMKLHMAVSWFVHCGTVPTVSDDFEDKHAS